jgi:hypothetical protein
VSETQPSTLESVRESSAPLLVVEPAYRDPVTGALYIHKDLAPMSAPWADEEHLPPVKAHEKFGDVESWVAYLKRFGGAEDLAPFLTWNKTGLRAVLDYHSAGEPDRCQWIATYPFTLSPEWVRWSFIADGRAIGHAAAVARLEDVLPDIVNPPATDLMAIMRTLRASVSAQASTELREDGTTSVVFSQDKKVSHGEVGLPSEFEIMIRVLTGHEDNAGRPVLYKLRVRIRASVDDAAKLQLRFTMPDADRVLEDVYADRVSAAKGLLGPEYMLLRAAD